MTRILGVDIPDHKRLEISLRYIFGVGPFLANQIIQKLKLDPGMKTKELTSAQVAQLTTLIEDQYMVEGNLRRFNQNNIKRLRQIGSYRGIRHSRGLPVRGQKTQTNARTRKGKKKTVANKKKAV